MIGLFFVLVFVSMPVNREQWMMDTRPERKPVDWWLGHQSSILLTRLGPPEASRKQHTSETPQESYQRAFHFRDLEAGIPEAIATGCHLGGGHREGYLLIFGSLANLLDLAAKFSQRLEESSYSPPSSARIMTART